MNQDLKQLHDGLLAQHQALYDKLDDVTDPALAKTIIIEMQEILHRIDLVQGLLFKQTTAALRQSLKKVQGADSDLTKALDSAQNAADFVKSVSSYLTYVDKAIDLAKALAV